MQNREDPHPELLPEYNQLKGQPTGRLHSSGWFTSKLYFGLLVFVVIAGLPLVCAPSVRGRLARRTSTLKEALGPFRIMPTPAWGKVGLNPYPVPKEFERPVVQRNLDSSVIPYHEMIFRAGGENVVRAGAKTGESSTKATPTAEDSLSGAGKVEFRQGKPEQEAYELLVKSNERIASMVAGSNPDLSFKSWSAAQTEEDSFLVDLLFLRAGDKSEAHYIWKVKPSTKEIMAMSYEAKKLSKR